jgi:tetratricopeptide (TPR) repeat protein
MSDRVVTSPKRAWCSVFLVLVLALHSAIPNAEAAPKKKKATSEASKHFSKGVSLFVEGNYEEAVKEFEKSYRIVAAFQVLYNIAMCYQALAKREKAASYLEQFIKKGGKKIVAARLAEAKALILLLKANKAVLTLVCLPVGSTVLIDGVKIGEAPLDTVHVQAGTHVILVQSPGFQPQSEEVDLKAGDQVKKVIILEETEKDGD